MFTVNSLPQWTSDCHLTWTVKGGTFLSCCAVISKHVGGTHISMHVSALHLRLKRVHGCLGTIKQKQQASIAGRRYLQARTLSPKCC